MSSGVKHHIAAGACHIEARAGIQQIGNDTCHRQAIQRATSAGLPNQTAHFMAGADEGTDDMQSR